MISGASSAAALQLADAAYLASIATYDDVLVTLLGDVTTTYIGIRTTQRQIEIAQENIVKQRKSLQVARDRYTGGIASKLPVYQAENVLGQTESAIPQLQIQLDKGLNALRPAPGHAAAIARRPAERRTGHPGTAGEASRSAFRPISCAAAPISAPPNWPPPPRVRRSASPRPISIPHSA